MNTYVTFACLLAVLGACHSNPVGYGYGGYGGIIAPAAISTANLYKAAPVSLVRNVAVSPIIAPAVTTVPVLKSVGVNGWGGYGLGGYGLGGYGLGGYGLGGYGLGGYGLGGHGIGGYGLGWGGKF